MQLTWPWREMLRHPVYTAGDHRVPSTVRVSLQRGSFQSHDMLKDWNDRVERGPWGSSS